LCGQITGGGIHRVRRDLVCDLARVEIAHREVTRRVSGRDLRADVRATIAGDRCRSRREWSRDINTLQRAA
jgi:hypothetical protein